MQKHDPAMQKDSAICSSWTGERRRGFAHLGRFHPNNTAKSMNTMDQGPNNQALKLEKIPKIHLL